MRRSVIHPFWADRHHGRSGRMFQIGDVIVGLEPLRDGVRVRFEFDSKDDSGTFVAENPSGDTSKPASRGHLKTGQL
jgi:hypothetical protein